METSPAAPGVAVTSRIEGMLEVRVRDGVSDLVMAGDGELDRERWPGGARESRVFLMMVVALCRALVHGFVVFVRIYAVFCAYMRGCSMVIDLPVKSQPCAGKRKLQISLIAVSHCPTSESRSVLRFR